MSFTKKIKAQLSRIDNRCDECNVSELSAIVRVCTSYRDGKVVITTENENVKERIELLFLRLFDVGISHSCRNDVFKFFPDTDFFTDVVAEKLKLFADDDFELAPFECCKAAYIRGAFLGGGSMLDPRTRYHLEFDAKHEGTAEQIRDILGEMGITAKITKRKEHFIVYLKEYEAIADILGAMGAVGAAMDLYNISIEKELRNAANRQANCEIANIERTTKTAFLQIESIKKVEKKIGFSNLPETLRQIALVRLEYPYESLKELGERLNPPIGKSGVNHRLKRIMEMAEKL